MITRYISLSTAEISEFKYESKCAVVCTNGMYVCNTTCVCTKCVLEAIADTETY